MPGDAFWKEDWDRARQRLAAWWQGDGLAVCILAPRATPRVNLPEPTPPARLQEVWLDPAYRARKAEYELSRTYFGGEAFPYFDTHVGPGNLALFIGSQPTYAPTTVWYNPCITDPAHHPPLRFDPANAHFREQRAILEAGVRLSRGRFLVGMPDLIENVDTLASLRGAQTLMVDLKERPAFVRERLAEINRAYFAAFAACHAIIRDEWGGNAFSAFHIWGPGKTAKVQCDASAMFSPTMFARFVAPPLAEQCAWLDHSLFHLDGTQCIVHLDVLLGIDELDAIEWTPQVSLPGGGDPMWYDLYRRILQAGKRVQAISVKPQEVLPLLDAVGPRGMFVITHAPDKDTARRLTDDVERYRQRAGL